MTVHPQCHAILDAASDADFDLGAASVPEIGSIHDFIRTGALVDMRR